MTVSTKVSGVIVEKIDVRVSIKFAVIVFGKVTAWAIHIDIVKWLSEPLLESVEVIVKVFKAILLLSTNFYLCRCIKPL